MNVKQQKKSYAALILDAQGESIERLSVLVFANNEEAARREVLSQFLDLAGINEDGRLSIVSAWDKVVRDVCEYEGIDYESMMDEYFRETVRDFTALNTQRVKLRYKRARKKLLKGLASGEPTAAPVAEAPKVKPLAPKAPVAVAVKAAEAERSRKLRVSANAARQAVAAQAAAEAPAAANAARQAVAAQAAAEAPAAAEAATETEAPKVRGARAASPRKALTKGLRSKAPAGKKAPEVFPVAKGKKAKTA